VAPPAQVERWSEWAPHIRSVLLLPPGELGPTSRGAFQIKGVGRSTFRMSAWEPPVRWEWVGGVPGLRIHYDHRFEPTGPVIDTAGVAGDSAWTPLTSDSTHLCARLRRNVDRAIPRLQEWFRVDEPSRGQEGQ
jgi:hypothetical protein